jgi:hypothetical protein
MEIKEMAYPQNFSFDELLKLTSYRKRIDYIQNRLQRISSGSSRIAYKVDEEKVLKVAKNRKGLAQNIAESDWGVQDMYSNSIAAKVFETDEKGIFLEMELARKVTPTKFKQILGFSIDDLEVYLEKYYLNYKHRELNPELEERMEENEWLIDLQDLAINFDHPIPGDFTKLSSYGLVSREGEERIVLIDFGFTNSVKRDYYDY